MGSDQYVIALTTIPADFDAETFAARLIDEKVAACVNVLPPMRSVYRWKDALEKEDERQLLIKTTSECLPRLETVIRTIHPYETPEFVVIPIAQGSAAYLSWISENTTP